MTKPFVLLLCGTFALSGCMGASTTGPGADAAVGGVLGAITAAALGASTEWVIIGTLAGAAAGALVGQNSRTGECAYADGSGGYYRAACR
ncbi:MAG: glycine zipper 2TM domain-containing protein [Pseudomonadota bacterium]